MILIYMGVQGHTYGHLALLHYMIGIVLVCDHCVRQVILCKTFL
jgi:hypothetical protein